MLSIHNRPIPLNLPHVFLRFLPWRHNLVLAPQATELKVHADAEDLPLVGAAGVFFL